MSFLSFCTDVVGFIASPITKAVKFTSHVVAEVAEGMTEVCGDLMNELGCKNASKMIKSGGKLIAGVFETTGNVVDYVPKQATNVVKCIVGGITGDEECREEGIYGLSDTNNEITSSASKIAKSGNEALDAYVGKDLFDELKSRYNKLRVLCEKEDKQIFENFSIVNANLTSTMGHINQLRKDTALRICEFEVMTSFIATWVVKKYNITEQIILKPYNIKLPPECHVIFKDVDFDNDPIENYFKGILTFGQWTRSDLNNAESKIIGQEKVLREDIGKANAEITRIKKASESIDFVENVFNDFYNLYTGVLRTIDYAISFLEHVYYQRDIYFFKAISDTDCTEKFDLYFLPEYHINCLMAGDKMTRIMTDLAKRQYFDSSKIKINDNDEIEIKKQYKALQESTKKAA